MKHSVNLYRPAHSVYHVQSICPGHPKIPSPGDRVSVQQTFKGDDVEHKEWLYCGQARVSVRPFTLFLSQSATAVHCAMHGWFCGLYNYGGVATCMHRSRSQFSLNLSALAAHSPRLLSVLPPSDSTAATPTRNVSRSEMLRVSSATLYAAYPGIFFCISYREF